MILLLPAALIQVGVIAKKEALSYELLALVMHAAQAEVSKEGEEQVP